MPDRCEACGTHGEIGRDLCPMYFPKGKTKYWWVCVSCREKKQKQMMEASKNELKETGKG